MKNKEMEKKMQQMIQTVGIRTSHAGMVSIAGTCHECGTFVTEHEGTMVKLFGQTVVCEPCEIEQGF